MTLQLDRTQCLIDLKKTKILHNHVKRLGSLSYKSAQGKVVGDRAGNSTYAFSHSSLLPVLVFNTLTVVILDSIASSLRGTDVQNLTPMFQFQYYPHSLSAV